MVSVKERTVKGKAYVYVTATASYKGKKKRFEKCVGPNDMDEERLKHKVEFYSALLEQKASLYGIHLEADTTEFTYLPEGFAFFMAMIRRQYHPYLESMYPTELEKYKKEFDVRYVHNTTAMEGNTCSLKETALILDQGMTPSCKKLREVHEIENYTRVLEFVRTWHKDITIKFILELHRLVQSNIDDETAGVLRRIDVAITGSQWEPPPAVVLEDELIILLDWYKDARGKMHPFELAAEFHHRFVQVHPFVDGNGRVARELLNFILEQHGFPPLIVPIESREDYIDCLETADSGDRAPLVEFFAHQLVSDYFSVVFEAVSDLGPDLGGALENLDQQEVVDLKEFMGWTFQLFTQNMAQARDLQLQLDPRLQMLPAQILGKQEAEKEEEEE